MLVSPAIAADGLQLRTVEVDRNGNTGRTLAETSSIFASESSCTSNGARWCVYLDLCNRRYWVPKNTADIVKNHLGPAGHGLEVILNHQSQCIAGKYAR